MTFQFVSVYKMFIVWQVEMLGCNKIQTIMLVSEINFLCDNNTNAI
jgi:hypothetical protein